MMRHGEPPEAGIGGPDAWTGGPGHAPAVRDDEAVTEAVKAALALEPGVDERRFEVHTRAGVVHLFAVATSQRERELAIQAAEAVTGVKGIEDEIRLEPGAPERATGASEAEERAARARREGWPSE